MKTRTAILSLLTVIAALMVTRSVIAAPTIYEPFTYPEGDTKLDGNTGGTGLSGSWSAENGYYDNDGTGLTWGSLETQGAAARRNGGWASASIAINTNAPGYTNLLADGGELWFSVIYDNGNSDQRSLVALSSVGIATGNGRLEADTADETSVGIGFGRTSDDFFYSKIWDDDNPENNGLPEWGNNNLTGPPANHVSSSNNEAPTNGTVFVVGHVQWGATTTDVDVVELYLPGTDLVLGDVVSTSQGVIADQSGIDWLGFSNLEDYGMFDEIRVGATYIDVGGPPPQGTVIMIR